MKIIVLTASILILASVFSGCSEQGTLTDTPMAGELAGQGQISAAQKGMGNVGLPGKGSTLRLKGIGQGYDGMVPDIDGDGEDDPALCFDVGLFNSAGKQIGTATDCLSNITGVTSPGPSPGTGPMVFCTEPVRSKVSRHRCGSRVP